MCIPDPEVDTSYQDFSMSEAERARTEEELRQLKIDEGLRQIAAIFEGGTYAAPVEYPEVYNVNPNDGPQGDQDEGSDGFLSSLFGSGGNTTSNEYADDIWKFDPITGRGDPRTYAGMTPVLEQRRQAMRDYYLPQLNDQMEDARDNLTYALSRAGLLKSTAAGEKQADMTKKFGLAQGDIMARIASDIANTKSRINQQRSAIEAGLRASGDQSAAANQALQSAVTFREDMPDLSPLGHLFAGLSEGIGAAAEGARARRIRKLATPAPLSDRGAARVVGA